MVTTAVTHISQCIFLWSLYDHKNDHISFIMITIIIWSHASMKHHFIEESLSTYPRLPSSNLPDICTHVTGPRITVLLGPSITKITTKMSEHIWVLSKLSAESHAWDSIHSALDIFIWDSYHQLLTSNGEKQALVGYNASDSLSWAIWLL